MTDEYERPNLDTSRSINAGNYTLAEEEFICSEDCEFISNNIDSVKGHMLSEHGISAWGTEEEELIIERSKYYRNNTLPMYEEVVDSKETDSESETNETLWNRVVNQLARLTNH